MPRFHWNFDSSKFTTYFAIIQTKIPNRWKYKVTFLGDAFRQSVLAKVCAADERPFLSHFVDARRMGELCGSRRFSRTEELRPTPFAKLAHSNPALAWLSATKMCAIARFRLLAHDHWPPSALNDGFPCANLEAKQTRADSSGFGGNPSKSPGQWRYGSSRRRSFDWRLMHCV